jgi:hypothetical protein
MKTETRVHIMNDFVLRAPPSLRKRPREDGGCAAVYEQGRQYEMDSPDWPVVMKPSSNCSIPIGDKIAFVGLPTDPEALKIYLNQVVRYTPETIANVDGIFTWLMYRTRGSEMKFAASKVLSPYEVGTLHRSIAKSVGAVSIHGAGEMEKKGKTIVFNTLSGSYMVDWFKKVKARDCTASQLEVHVSNEFRNMMRGYTLQTTTKTLVDLEHLKPTMEELQLYADFGFVVCLHDAANIEQCKQVKGTCETPLQARQ